MQHGRIPWPIPDQLHPDQRALYDAIVGGPRAAGSAFALTDPDGRLEGPFNAMLLSPGIGSATQELGAAIRYRSALSDREREIAILTLAVARRSEFEWYAHERVGARIGLTEDELEALSEGRPASTWSESESIVASITSRLTKDRDVDDPEFERARDTLGIEKLSDLVTLVGYYDHLALALTVWRTPLPAGVAPHFDRTVRP